MLKVIFKKFYNKISFKQILITTSAAIAVLLGIIFVHYAYKADFARMIKDLADLEEAFPLDGFLSSFGILIWWTAAAICCFTALVLRSHLTRDEFGFLMGYGGITTVLALDDLYMFHERLGPNLLGISEKAIYIAYILIIIILGFRYWKVLLETSFYGLAIALFCFAFSAFIDFFIQLILLDRIGQWSTFIEEGAKWIGIVWWCSYFLHTCQQFFHQKALVKITS